MKVLFRYLRPYVLLAVFCVCAVFLQAMGELKLPDYMSDVVNVGVQRYGIEDGLAGELGADTLARLSLLMSESGQAAAGLAYELSDGRALLRSGLSAADEQAASAAMTRAFALYYALGAPDSGVDREGLMQTLAGMPAQARLDLLAENAAAIEEKVGAMEGQLCALGVREEYARIDVDADAIRRASIARVGGKMLLVALLVACSAILAGLLASRIAAGVARDLRRDVFARTLSFSGVEIDRFSTASLITRTTNDIQQVQNVTSMLFRIVLFAPFMGFGSLLYALQKSPSLAWVLGLAVLVLIGMVVLLFTLSMPRFKKLQTLIDRLNRVTRENLSGVMVSRAYNAQDFERARFDGANRELTRTNLFLNRLMSVMQPGMSLLMNGMTLLIVWFGARLIEQSALQIGDMMAYLQYAMHVVMSFMFISMIFIMLPRAAVSLARVREVLETEPAIGDPAQPVHLPEGEGRGVVSFEHVSFTYPGAEEPTLHDVSFTARPGQTTAIIGATGSGKTTLLNLIPRIYEAGGGTVRVGGCDVRTLTQEELRAAIGYAPQKAVLFTGTIADNLRLGAPEAGADALARAARIAQAADFVSEKARGFDEPIAQGGSNVSGGQRQRLSVARALATDADILLFDDTFSALDFKTDAALRRALAEEAQGKTLLLVAQRVGTIRHAEQILVLDEGRIVGRGTHEELMAGCETYRDIARSQLREEELQ